MSSDYFKKSFTLIEMLLVIAVIGLMSSIILVSFKGTREKAKIAKSLAFSQSLHNVLGSDAVGVWGFDEGSGTEARDGSGYGNNGTISGAIYTSDTPHNEVGIGSGKYALSFDGVDDSVNVGTVGRYSNTVTVEAWILHRTGDLWDDIVAGGCGDLLFAIRNNAFLQFGGQCSQPFLGGEVNVDLRDRWHHVVGSYDGTSLKIYIDGVQRHASAQSGSFSPGVVYIGATSPWGELFRGLIDEVRIYARALTQAEIQKLYVEGLKKYQNLAQK